MSRYVPLPGLTLDMSDISGINNDGSSYEGVDVKDSDPGADQPDQLFYKKNAGGLERCKENTN
jgi:hypothetical protein